MDLKEKFKYVNFQIAFLVEQLKDEEDEDVIKHVSEKIATYEKQGKRLACQIMSYRPRSVAGR